MVRDLNENAKGTLTPWRLSELSDGGEAMIEGAPGSCDDSKRYVGIIAPRDLDDGDEVMRSQLDARRIVAAVNLTQSIDLETLERLVESPPLDGVITIEDLQEATAQHNAASREAAYYFSDED